MSDSLVDQPRHCPRVEPAEKLTGRELRHRTVYWIAAATAVLIWLRLWISEGSISTVLFAALVSASCFAVVLLLTRRLLVATVLVTGQIVLISVASWVKLKYMNMVLHAYDLAFYLPSWTTISFLWDSYRAQMLAVIAAIMLSAVAVAFAYRVDPTRACRFRTAFTAMVLVGATWLAAGLTGERRHSQFEYEGMYLTNFYMSWSETIEALRRGHLLEAAERAAGPLLMLPERCEPGAKPPHIILIHHESIVPPSLFPTLAYDRNVDGFFASDGGETLKMRVETYGGASTLTEFSVLTGLSTYAFGGMRQFVQKLMAGKIKDTLPQALSRCGYRNVLFYPMLKNFVFADRFFNGAGITEIRDLKDQGAKRVNERDGFYYKNAMDEIERHIARSRQPLFTFIETMATHWPYDKTWEPQLEVPGGGPGTHPEMHEYLRRLSIAHQDWDELRSELARRFPGEQFLIVRYGDHHPMSTRMLLGYDESTEAEDVALDRNSIGFQTFFAVNGVNYQPNAYTTPHVLDVPYLGTVMLEAAGLPMSDAWKKRQKLKAVCNGLSFDCPQRGEVLSFHRLLIDSGLISAH